MPESYSNHPIPDNSNTQVWINAETKLNCKVVTSAPDQNLIYHYQLQVEISDPNTNSANIQLVDVLENFVLLNPTES